MPKLSRELQKLLIGQVPADFADWLDFVAIGALLAFTWDSEPYVFAVLAVSLGLPYLIIGPFAGHIVDRSDTKSILIWSNIGRGVATASFFFAASWPILMVLIALRSSIDTFFTPAKQSAIQSLTERDIRTRANAISHGINQASKIVAPAIGGALLIRAEPQFVFLVNACVSMLAAALLLRLRPLKSRKNENEEIEQGALTAIRNGLGLIGRDHVLKAAIGMMAGGYFAMFFYDTLIAPLTRNLGFDQTHLGLALAAVGGGGVLGAIVLANANEAKRPFLTVALGFCVGGLIAIGLGIFEIFAMQLSLALFLLAFFVLGICTALSVVPFRTILQNHTAEGSIGQVTAFSEAINTFALLTAPFIGAWIATIFSYGASFILGGTVMLLVGLRAIAMRNVA